MSAAAAEKLVACKPVEGRKASVEFTKDAHGLDVAILRDPRGFVAQVHLHGGQVTAWKNDRGEDLLFVSSKANFKPPKAIRGGIPISFPQFSNLGLTEQHGFARNRLWATDPDPAPLPPSGDNKATIDLILKQSSIEDQKIWNHRLLTEWTWSLAFAMPIVWLVYLSQTAMAMIWRYLSKAIVGTSLIIAAPYGGDSSLVDSMEASPRSFFRASLAP
ncbi:hypothetical protein L7F22_021138 [Adiantum nelumboides]|nr:hypothetical protein [Adiantum nelumboides]